VDYGQAQPSAASTATAIRVLTSDRVQPRVAAASSPGITFKKLRRPALVDRAALEAIALGNAFSPTTAAATANTILNTSP